MEGQAYYYNNKTKNICLINKDLLGLLFKNQKIKNVSKILTKSYEDMVKSKDIPFETINKNYYKWKVTNTDFIVIALDKSLDETLTFLKIPTNNYKTTIEEVNIVNKIDLNNLKQYKKLEDYDATTNIQLFKGVIDKYFNIVNIPSSEIKIVSNTNNLYETYCILDNTILYTVRFNLNQDNTVTTLIVFNIKADLTECLKDFVKENGHKIQKIFNSWNEFIVFLELLPKDLDNSVKSDEGYIIKNFDFTVDNDWLYDNGTFGSWSSYKEDAIKYKTKDQVKDRCIEIVKDNYAIGKDDKFKLKIVYQKNEVIMIVIPNKSIEELDKYEQNNFANDYHFFDKFSDGEIIEVEKELKDDKDKWQDTLKDLVYCLCEDQKFNKKQVEDEINKQNFWKECLQNNYNEGKVDKIPNDNELEQELTKILKQYIYDNFKLNEDTFNDWLNTNEIEDYRNSILEDLDLDYYVVVRRSDGTYLNRKGESIIPQDWKNQIMSPLDIYSFASDELFDDYDDAEYFIKNRLYEYYIKDGLSEEDARDEAKNDHYVSPLLDEYYGLIGKYNNGFISKKDILEKLQNENYSDDIIESFKNYFE